MEGERIDGDDGGKGGVKRQCFWGISYPFFFLINIGTHIIEEISTKMPAEKPNMSANRLCFLELELVKSANPFSIYVLCPSTTHGGGEGNTMKGRDRGFEDGDGKRSRAEWHQEL
ncbi:hypothetical protein L2E82_38958 [Cichorium intybus]|uniref:Uncharacterized protein n=1 Tax=Cichorium intybus TaxID=13427 RepID=A0ACB9AG46_CICIN|nr:hypothetical protein L2E82_38958 [Cichorium intybus]